MNTTRSPKVMVNIEHGFSEKQEGLKTKKIGSFDNQSFVSEIMIS